MKQLGLLFVLVGIILSGCATVSSEQRTRWNETIPVCSTDFACKTKWAAARQWVQNNSGYRIQIYTDDLIDTYNPAEYDPKIAVTVSKTPVGKTPSGHQVNTFNVQIRCGNIFGCIPTIEESILSFNKFVSQTEVNDPSCYTDMIDKADNARIGILPQYYNGKYIIREVCSHSPAQEAGLITNDVITKIENTAINNAEDANKAMDGLKHGKQVKIDVIRNGLAKTLTLNTPSKEYLESIISKRQNITTNVASKPVDTEQKLEALSRLLAKDIITKEEFDQKKKKLLSDM